MSLTIYRCGCEIAYQFHDTSFDDPEEPWWPRRFEYCQIHGEPAVYLGIPYSHEAWIMENFSTAIWDVVLSESPLMMYLKGSKYRAERHAEWIDRKYGTKLVEEIK